MYPKGGKHPHEWINCTSCGERALVRAHGKGFCSVRCAQSGENNSTWRGDDAGYTAVHGRVYRAKSKATSCLFGDHPGPFDWANLLGDYPDTADYAQMCRSCHAGYDNAVRKMQPARCKRGHSLNGNADYYIRVVGGREVRQCKQCAKDRAKRERSK